MKNVQKYFTVYIMIQTFLHGVHLLANDKESSKVVFELPNMIPVKVRKRNAQTGETPFFSFNVDQKMLQFYNISKAEIENGYIEDTGASTAEIVMSTGLRLPIQVRSDEIVKIHRKNGKLMFNLSKFGFMSRKMEDLEGDETLIPSKQNPLLKWPPIIRCNFSSLLTSLTSSSIEILSQNSLVIARQVYGTFKNETWWSGQGILVTAVNPSTCDVTFTETFFTGDFGYFRNLIWTLESIAVGRIIIVTSLRDGSVVLSDARQAIFNLGSIWSKFYSFRDGWISAFVKGGRMLNEILIPNFGGLLSSGSPVSMHVRIPLESIVDSQECYKNWPSTAAWIARRHFCDSHDGYGELCDCSHPFVVGEHIAINVGESFVPPMEQIPMIIMAGNRTRHLFRLLHSVGNQPGVVLDSFILAIDGVQETTNKLAFILGLKALIHRSEGITGKARVANNLRFGMFNAYKMFPSAKNFIVLEDDLVLAPDFYAYMTYLAPIFELDKSVLCVSAFNHLSFPHTSSDPSRIYRAHTNPSLGWMISRENLEFIVPKILPQEIDGDWDYFIGSEFVRGNREILIPDINRSYHPSTTGLHVSGSLATELMYLSRNLNKRTIVKMVPLKSLIKEEYEREFVTLIKSAVPVSLNEEGEFTISLKVNGVYIIYVKKKNADDEDSFMFIGDILGIWSKDARDHHNHAWRISYSNATLFIVGVPVSPYSKYMPLNYRYISAPISVEEDILASQRELYLSLPIMTHLQEMNLPDFYYSFSSPILRRGNQNFSKLWRTSIG